MKLPSRGIRPTKPRTTCSSGVRNPAAINLHIERCSERVNDRLGEMGRVVEKRKKITGTGREGKRDLCKTGGQGWSDGANGSFGRGSHCGRADERDRRMSPRLKCG